MHPLESSSGKTEEKNALLVAVAPSQLQIAVTYTIGRSCPPNDSSQPAEPEKVHPSPAPASLPAGPGGRAPGDPGDAGQL
jgi:hypothetical protein